MKLKILYEYVAPYGPGVEFYGDPAWKNGKGTKDTSFLVGGEEDRERFLGKMNQPKKKKKKKKSKKK